METKNNIKADFSPIENLLLLIKDFFEEETIFKHLSVLDKWMNKIISPFNGKKKLKEAHIFNFFEKLSPLLVESYQIIQSQNPMLQYFGEITCINIENRAQEKRNLIYYPIHLKNKEISYPTIAMREAFNKIDLSNLQETLKLRIRQNNKSESIKRRLSPTELNFFICYRNLKKLIESYWLIHERLVSLNSYKVLKSDLSSSDYYRSCPVFLEVMQSEDPNNIIDAFFNFDNIYSYQVELKNWFDKCLNENECYENPSNLLFLHQQLTQLLHALYLLKDLENSTPSKNLPKHAYKNKENQTIDNTVHRFQFLNIKEQENPINYIKEVLTLENITLIRAGLKEWLFTGMSRNTSLHGLENNLIFPQYEQLQKLLEVAYLIYTSKNNRL